MGQSPLWLLSPRVMASALGEEEERVASWAQAGGPVEVGGALQKPGGRQPGAALGPPPRVPILGAAS